MSIRAIAFDLDGTLIAGYSAKSSGFKNPLATIAAKGERRTTPAGSGDRHRTQNVW